MKNKKRLILLPALTLLFGSALTGCDWFNKPSDPVDETVHVESVTVSQETLEIEVEASANLTAEVLPANATNTAITWSTSDEAVATVSAIGKVTGVAAGTATITVTTEDGGKTDECQVTVIEAGSTYGTAKKPLTCAEAQAIINEECAESGSFTAEPLYIKGYILNNPAIQTGTTNNQYYSNMYIADTDDASTADKLLIYTVNILAAVPYQHDQVILHGYFTNYNGKLEMSNKESEYPAFDSIVARGTSKIASVPEHCTINSLPQTATNASAVNFTVTPDSGYEIVAVKANGVALEGTEGSYALTVKGDTVVIVDAKQEGTTVLTAAMKYTDSANTGNMTGNNDATKVNLDAGQFSVVADKGSADNYPGLNKALQIRLYNSYKVAENIGKGNIITVSSTAVTITKIIVNVDGSSPATIAAAQVKAGETVVTGNSGVYQIENGKFSIQNVATETVSCQLWLKSVDIYYTVNPEVAATSVSLNKTALTLKAGESETLTATLAPANSTSSVTWLTSDANVATVNAGAVTAVAGGTATITAFVDTNANGVWDEGEVKDEATVTVSSTKTTTVVTSPVAGTKYKLGFYSTSKSATYYGTGVMNGYFGATTTDPEAGADYELVEVEGGYNIKVTLPDGTTVKYLNITVSGKNVNVAYGDSASTVWTINATYNCPTTIVSGCTNDSKNGENYVGSYGSNTTLGPSAISYAASSYVGQFRTIND